MLVFNSRERPGGNFALTCSAELLRSAEERVTEFVSPEVVASDVVGMI